MKKIFFVCLFFCMLVPCFAQKVDWTKKIWDSSNYAAFTSMAYDGRYYYCAFREGDAHVAYENYAYGTIRILRSRNGRTWKEYLTFTKDGCDLRDPHLSIAPNGLLYLLTESVTFKGKEVDERSTLYSFIASKRRFTPLASIVLGLLTWNWLWDLEWINNAGYGFIYAPYFAFCKTRDGKEYTVLKRYKEITGVPTEASLLKVSAFKYISVVRRRDGGALLGVTENIESDWSFTELPEWIGSPKMFSYKGRVYLVGRRRETNSGKQITALYEINLNDKTLNFIFDISSGSDSGYPGVVVKGNKVYVSYYSGDASDTDIYLTRISL